MVKSKICLGLYKNSYVFIKIFLNGLLFLICIFSFIGICVNAEDSLTYQTKLYIDCQNLELFDNVIYIHLGDQLIETGILRTDQKGFYIFENDIINCGNENEKKWRCPYCYHWWPIGEKCKNKEYPTNKW